jgi:expansin (peptidoglycan-binding protein)
MPSKSAKQHRFMEAAAHNPKFAKKAGIPVAVAKEYVKADARKGKGGRK